MSSNFCFIIPSYCATVDHLIQLDSCLSKIRKYHNNTVYVIDDYSTVNITDCTNKYKNIITLKSQNKGAGDMVTYLNFLSLEYKNAVIFQDSMNLETALENVSTIDDVRHIWYFTNHRLHWSHIKEPQNEYNIANGIKFHDHLIIDCIKNTITKSDFQQWLLDIYHQKEKWSGNIGCQSIIDKEFLINLNERTGIVDTMALYDNNRLRRVAESLFPLACQYISGKQASDISYDGLYYDGVNPNNGKSGNIICKNKYFSKISFNRRPINTQ